MALSRGNITIHALGYLAIVARANLPAMIRAIKILYMPLGEFNNTVNHPLIFLSGRTGWDDLTREAATVYNAFPPQDRVAAGIKADAYASVGAIDQFGRQNAPPHCAAVSHLRIQVAFHIQTRSPMRRDGTFGPTSPQSRYCGVPDPDRGIKNPAYPSKQDFLFAGYNNASQPDREPGSLIFGRFQLQTCSDQVHTLIDTQ